LINLLKIRENSEINNLISSNLRDSSKVEYIFISKYYRFIYKYSKLYNLKILLHLYLYVGMFYLDIQLNYVFNCIANCIES